MPASEASGQSNSNRCRRSASRATTLRWACAWRQFAGPSRFLSMELAWRRYRTILRWREAMSSRRRLALCCQAFIPPRTAVFPFPFRIRFGLSEIRGRPRVPCANNRRWCACLGRRIRNCKQPLSFRKSKRAARRLVRIPSGCPVEPLILCRVITDTRVYSAALRGSTSFGQA